MQQKPYFSGPDGEEAAARYLEKKGYKILKRNYRTCGVEVDLIAMIQDLICFVEVKTRKTNLYGLPEEFVHPAKRKKIILGARVFLANKAYEEMRVRFDIISLVHRGEQGAPIINHIENAFEEE